MTIPLPKPPMKSLPEITAAIESAGYSWLLRSCSADEPPGYFAHVSRGDLGIGDSYSGGRSRQLTPVLALESAYLRARRADQC